MLFEPSDFFLRYAFYVRVDVSASNEKDFDEWNGHIGRKCVRELWVCVVCAVLTWGMQAS